MCNDFESCILKKSCSLYWFFVSMAPLIELIDRVYCRLISNLNSCNSISSKCTNFFPSDPVRASLNCYTNDTRCCGFVSFFSFIETFRCLHCISFFYLESRKNIIPPFIWLKKRTKVIIGRMSIIYSLHEVFLVFFWIDTPSSANDTNITLCDGISCNLEWSESILYLTHWIKGIHLSTLNCRLSCNIAFGKSIIRRTKYTLSRTSPKLRQKRDNWYTR